MSAILVLKLVHAASHLGQHLAHAKHQKGNAKKAMVALSIAGAVRELLKK
jgi:hypothetical protein